MKMSHPVCKSALSATTEAVQLATGCDLAGLAVIRQRPPVKQAHLESHPGLLQTYWA